MEACLVTPFDFRYTRLPDYHHTPFFIAMSWTKNSVCSARRQWWKPWLYNRESLFCPPSSLRDATTARDTLFAWYWEGGDGQDVIASLPITQPHTVLMTPLNKVISWFCHNCSFELRVTIFQGLLESQIHGRNWSVSVFMVQTNQTCHIWVVCTIWWAENCYEV